MILSGSVIVPYILFGFYNDFLAISNGTIAPSSTPPIYGEECSRNLKRIGVFGWSKILFHRGNCTVETNLVHQPCSHVTLVVGRIYQCSSNMKDEQML